MNQNLEVILILFIYCIGIISCAMEQKNQHESKEDIIITSPIISVDSILDNLPKADFKIIQESNLIPTKIKFKNRSEHFENILWDFGNGQTSQINNPAITFNKEGDYIITLTVENKEGESDKREKKIHLNKPITELNIIVLRLRLLIGCIIQLSDVCHTLML